MIPYRRRNLVFLSSILLLCCWSGAAASVPHSNHALPITSKQRLRIRQTIQNCVFNRKRRNVRLLAAGISEDGDYSGHRMMHLDDEPILSFQQENESNKQEEEKPPMPAWKRFLTRPTESIWPMHSTSSLSKVPMAAPDTSVTDANVENNGIIHETTTAKSAANTKTSTIGKDQILFDPLESFLSNETRSDEDSTTRQTLDVHELVPALALPSSLSLSSIRNKLFGILKHPNLPKWTLNGLQLGIAIYLLHALAKAAAEVMDEISNDTSPHLLKVDQVKQIIASLETEENDNGNKPSSLLEQQPTLQHLTSTLLASGMPLRSHQDENSVERVLLSLTKSEANLLQQCLWTPTKESSFANIAGLQSIKQSLLDLVWTVKTSSSKQHQALNPYSHLVEHPPGILLYGPPGCGKTMLVKALAASTQLPCLVVTPSVLLRKYVGDTNLQVRALFSLAQKLSPCILCIDELDGLFRERSSTEHDVSRDLKTEFLQWWDGIASDGRILIVGATNRPFEVDSAVLRRMPQSYFVGLPNYEARRSLLSSLLTSIPTSSDLQLHPLAAETEGYTPSDLKQVVRMAITMGPIREARFSLKYRPLSMKDVGHARSMVSPTPLTPGYRAALTDYAQRNSGMHQANAHGNNNNANQNSFDSFFNAGTFHASEEHYTLPEWNEDANGQNVDDDSLEEEEYSYDQDDDDIDESESEEEL